MPRRGRRRSAQLPPRRASLTDCRGTVNVIMSEDQMAMDVTSSRVLRSHTRARNRRRQQVGIPHTTRSTLSLGESLSTDSSNNLDDENVDTAASGNLASGNMHSHRVGSRRARSGRRSHIYGETDETASETGSEDDSDDDDDDEDEDDDSSDDLDAHGGINPLQVFSDLSDDELFEGFGAEDDDEFGLDHFAEVIVFLESGDFFDSDGNAVQGDDSLSDDGELPEDPNEREIIGSIPEPSMSLHAAAVRGNMKELRRWQIWKMGRWARKARGDSELHCAARSGDVATVEQLITEGASVSATNRRDHTPLEVAARNGHAGVVKVLLQHGAGSDPEEMDRAFCATKSWAVVQALAEQEPVDPRGTSGDELERSRWFCQMLFRVVQKGRVTMLRGLLSMGANANCSGILGWTPLQIAARRGHIRCVSILLESGADVTGRDDFKWTALHYAAREGHREIAQMLLKAGADIDAKCRTGRTPLEVATDEETRHLLETYKDWPVARTDAVV